LKGRIKSETKNYEKAEIGHFKETLLNLREFIKYKKDKMNI
jgi:hypothetical protein